MTMDRTYTINYREYATVDALAPADRELVRLAVSAAATAYAPYSKFHVGAALRLADGRVVTGSNQENAAYPSGLCAERTALFAASAHYPDQRDYEALAIVGCNHEGHLCEAAPCGACRQVMMEYESQQSHPMRVLCYTADGGVREFQRVADLLPFGFEM